MGEPAMEEIGRVKVFFAKASAAAVELTASLRIGERIYLKGHTTDFQQLVESMQIAHQAVQEAGPGQSVGIRVAERCRPHDVVYKLTA